MTATRAAARFLTGTLLAGFLLAGPALAELAAARAAAAPARPRAVMIMLDINTSVTKPTFGAEKEAAVAFATALPADVRAGLITFSTTWRVTLAPTTDRARLTTLVSAAKRSGGTSAGLPAALPAAAALVRAGSADRILIFSNAEELTGSLAPPGLPVDVVVLDYGADDDVALLRSLARATNGADTNLAGATALAAAFPPLQPPGAGTGGQAGPASPGPAAGSAAPLTWPGSLPAPLVATGVFATLLGVLLLATRALSRHTKGRELAARFGHYGQGRAATAERGKLARTALQAITRMLRSGKAEQGLRERLEQAGFAGNPAEWALLVAGASVALGVLAAALARVPMLGPLVAGLTGWLGARTALNLMTARRRAAFADQLPDLLRLVAGSLRSGYSLPQAFDGAVRDDAQPTAAEFGRALAETRIGVEFDAALEAVAARMCSDDLNWTVMAIRIQREVGGNLPELLDKTAHTIMERSTLRRQVRALSAEGRLSACILVALPAVVGTWLFLTDRAYLRPLYSTQAGIAMLSVSGVLLVTGIFWMRKLIKVEA